MRTSTKTQHKLDMAGVLRKSHRGIKSWGFWKMNIWIKYLSSYTLSFQLSFIFSAMKFKTNYLLSDKDTWYSCSYSPKEKQPSPTISLDMEWRKHLSNWMLYSIKNVTYKNTI